MVGEGNGTPEVVNGLWGLKSEKKGGAYLSGKTVKKGGGGEISSEGGLKEIGGSEGEQFSVLIVQEPGLERHDRRRN